MEDFDWVRARNLCSLSHMFQQLKLEIKNDVDARNSLRQPNSYYGFKFAEAGDRFAVSREGNFLSRSIAFTLTETNISIEDSEKKVSCSATLTLNDDRECMFKVNGKELHSWQFRKLILEEMFYVF